MTWAVFLEHAIGATVLMIVLLALSYLWRKFIAKGRLTRWDPEYLDMFTREEIGPAVFWWIIGMGVIGIIQVHVYPWLGVPVIGYTGVWPFVFGILILYILLYPFRIFRDHGSLRVGVALFVGPMLVALFLLYLGTRYGNTMRILFGRP
jgi:hypothetical protein